MGVMMFMERYHNGAMTPHTSKSLFKVIFLNFFVQKNGLWPPFQITGIILQGNF